MRPLRAAPLITVVAMLGPIVAGLLGTVLPAVGLLPALGGTSVSLAPFAALAAWPGLPGAVALSLGTGLGATALSLAVVILFVAGWQGTRAMAVLERALSPLLSVPHAAAAFGLAFLIAPSGWIARALSPWATGWERPPDLLILQDPWGATMVAGLVAKETPFLLLMTLAALPQAQPARRVTIARALGYGRVTGWLKAVFPAVYSQIRLPVYAVLAYSMSVVDVAIILAPATPPPLAVQVVRWMADPDLALRFQAAAGAVLQLALVLGALGLWHIAEIAAARAGRGWAEAGARRHGEAALRGLGLGLATLAALAVIAGLGVLALWSVAGFWAFPGALPDAVSVATWARDGPALVDPTRDTILIAAAATALALVLTLACLEAEYRFGVVPGGRSLWLLYLPLLVPQVAFLPGLQTFALMAGAETGMGAVIFGHLVFVLPYVFLALAAPWRAWDTRHATVAAALGAGPWRVFATVRLPMLLAPTLTAAAVGFAVSVGQYLPTLLIGGGRVQTLTTEAVALASGGDRRVIGATALAQTGVVVLGFALALAAPRIAWANRRKMRAT
ncbi:putative thiamine transport system permease protein [Rhodovulum sp. ES.010]|uniref:ABC transporter permease n=1 Tax=Rhodovulum sp. ES.010 TaxID=1882821 RepID=UPI00092ADB81|nr:ABC transporter permease subunit [Rhodovulum sp. ES.010]SIO04195.1 putative thiamine transport system permease protein [Rhodovulum sp. ES.010]